MEIKRGLIETEAVGEGEIEGVIFENKKHLAPIVGSFTCCGRPIREYTFSGHIVSIGSKEFNESCEACKEKAQKRAS